MARVKKFVEYLKGNRNWVGNVHTVTGARIRLEVEKSYLGNVLVVYGTESDGGSSTAIVISRANAIELIEGLQHALPMLSPDSASSPLEGA